MLYSAANLSRLPLALVAYAALAIAPAALQAQSSVPEPASISESAANDPIIISGLREVEREINNFATAISISEAQSPMALYRPGDYCPRVVGLGPARDAAIARRMMEVARAAGVEPADGDCATSALVLFAADPNAMLAQFRRMHPEYFSEINGETIIHQGRDGPARSWKLLARVDRGGVPVDVGVDDGVQYITAYYAMSRLEASSRPVIAMSVLLIDTQAIAGLTVQQLADYAVMRSLTEAEPREMESSRVPTVLRVVEAADSDLIPLSLTNWDLAYIKTRYALNVWNLGKSQMAAIRTNMRRELLDTGDVAE